VNREAPKYVPRVKRIAGGLGVPSCSDLGEGDVSDSLFTNWREHIISLVAQHAIPAIYPFRDFADAGGLISYGANLADEWRKTGVYAGRILKGEKPGDLPVLLPTKFELVINLKTAKALGLTIPTIMQMTADDLIE
jgi:ABC-type uncharacterized transport system substrate-binding protein